MNRHTGHNNPARSETTCPLLDEKMARLESALRRVYKRGVKP